MAEIVLEELDPLRRQVEADVAAQNA